MWKNINLSNSFVSQLGNLAKDVFNDSSFSEPGAKLRNSDDEASYDEGEEPVNTNSSFNLQKHLDYDDDITSEKIWIGNCCLSIPKINKFFVQIKKIETLEAEIETLREKLSTEVRKNKATSKQYREELEAAQVKIIKIFNFFPFD